MLLSCHRWSFNDDQSFEELPRGKSRHGGFTLLWEFFFVQTWRLSSFRYRSWYKSRFVFLGWDSHCGRDHRRLSDCRHFHDEKLDCVAGLVTEANVESQFHVKIYGVVRADGWRDPEKWQNGNFNHFFVCVNSFFVRQCMEYQPSLWRRFRGKMITV